MITRSKVKSKKNSKKTPDESAINEAQLIDFNEKIFIFEKKLSSEHQQNNELIKKIKVLEKEKENLTNNIKTLKNKYSTMIEDNEKLKLLSSKNKNLLEDNQSELKSIVSLNTRLKSDNERINIDNIQLNDNLISNKKELEQFQSEIIKLKSTIEPLKFNLSELRNKLETYSNLYETTKENNKEFQEKYLDLESKNTAMSFKYKKDLELNKIKLDKCINENKEYENNERKFKNEIKILSSKLKNLSNERNTSKNEYLCESEIKNKTIALLKRGKKNLKENITILKNECSEKEINNKKLIESLESKQKELESLEEKYNKLSEISMKSKQLSYSNLQDDFKLLMNSLTPSITLQKSDIYLSIKNINEFNLSPTSSSNEIYQKFLEIYDLYKNEYEARNKVEHILRKFTIYIERKAPILQSQQMHYEVLKKSFADTSKKLLSSKDKMIKQKFDINKLREKISYLSNKYSNNSLENERLKTQINHLLYEKNNLGNDKSKYVFDDIHDLHKKYNELIKQNGIILEKDKKIDSLIITEKKKIMINFSEKRDKYEKLIKSYEDTIKSLTKKINSRKNKDHIEITHPGTNNLYKNILEDLRKSFQDFQSEKIKDLSLAENRALKAESEKTSLLLKVSNLENDLKHEKKMREISESDIKRLTQNLQENTESNIRLDEKLYSFREKIDDLENSLQNKSEEINLQSAEIDSQKYQINLYQQFEKDYLIKMEELSTKLTKEENKNKISKKDEISINSLILEKRDLEKELQSITNKYNKELNSSVNLSETTSKKIISMNEELNKEKEKITNLNEKNNSLTNKIKEQNIIIKSLTERNNKLKDFETIVNNAKEKMKSYKDNKLKMYPKGLELELDLKYSVTKLIELEKELEEYKITMKNTENLCLAKENIIKKLNEENDRNKKDSQIEIERISKYYKELELKLKNKIMSEQKLSIECGKLKEIDNNSKLKLKILKENHDKLMNDLKRDNKEIQFKYENNLKKMEENKKILVDVRKMYEEEVKRHGETVAKFRKSENDQTNIHKEVKLLKSKNEAVIKELDSLKISSSKENELNIRRIEDLEKLKGKMERDRSIMLDELNSANETNRYLVSTAEMKTPPKETFTPNNNLKKEIKNYKDLLIYTKSIKDKNESSLHQIKIDKEKLSTELKSKNSLIDTLRRTNKDQMKFIAKLSKSENEMKKLENQSKSITILEESNQHLREKLSKIQTELNELFSKNKEITSKDTSKTHQINTLSSQNSNLKNQVDLHLKAKKDWEKRCLDIFQSNNFIDPKIHAQTKKSLENSINTIKELNNKYSSVNEIKNQEIEKLKKDIKSYLISLNQSKSEINKLKESINKQTKFIKENSIEDMKKENKTIKQNIQNASKEILSLIAMKTELEDKIKEKNNQPQKEIENLKKSLIKYQMLTRKQEVMLNEEKEKSEIFQRNAQAANARSGLKQSQLNEMNLKILKLKKNMEYLNSSNSSLRSILKSKMQSGMNVKEDDKEFKKEENLFINNKSSDETIINNLSLTDQIEEIKQNIEMGEKNDNLKKLGDGENSPLKNSITSMTPVNNKKRNAEFKNLLMSEAITDNSNKKTCLRDEQKIKELDKNDLEESKLSEIDDDEEVKMIEIKDKSIKRDENQVIKDDEDENRELIEEEIDKNIEILKNSDEKKEIKEDK